MGISANLSSSIVDKACETFKNSYSNIFRIEMKIYSDNNPDVVVKPLSLKAMNIIQDFENKFHESITAILNITAEEALLLVANPQDLRCSITFIHVEQHYYKDLENVDPEIKKYRVMITSPDDIRKSLQKVEFASQESNSVSGEKHTPDEVRSARYDLPVELMDEKLFELRTRPINAILQKATVTDAIHYAANLLEIKKVQMTTSDNTTQYNNIFIPPMQTLETLFDMFQKTYGIYSKGLGYFYFDDTLFVFDEFNTDPQSDLEIDLYKVPKDEYPGCESYNCVDGSNLRIIILDDVNIKGASEIGTEKTGNYQITKRTDTTLDTDSQRKGKDATIRQNNMLAVSAENEYAATQGRVSATYQQSSNNPLDLSSQMANGQCVVMGTKWRMAWPWLITPGTKVVYHYEEMSGLKTITGIVSAIEYSLSIIDTTGGQIYHYAWEAKFACRLSPNRQEDEQISTSMFNTLAESKK